jgi:hypothetical protein
MRQSETAKARTNVQFSSASREFEPIQGDSNGEETTGNWLDSS